MAKASDESKSKLSTTAKQVVDKFQASWDYAKQNHHHRWERNWKLYNNKRTAESYIGVTNTFVPMPFSIIETATSALTSGRPSIDFVPQDMYQYVLSYAATGVKPDLKALNSLFDYYWECDNWDLKTVKTVRGGFLYGIAGEWVHWDVDKPRVINLAARDMIIDPALSDPMQLITNPNDYYTGRRYMTTLKNLKAERIVDPENPGKTKPRFSNLHLVRTASTGGEHDDKAQKEMLIGSVNTSKDTVEVIEIWDGKRIRSVANRAVDIEDRENVLGIHCLGITRFIADESLIHGKSILDPIAQQVEYLNDLSNQRLDAVTDQLNPQWELDPAYADKANQVNNRFGTVYPFTPGSLRPLLKNQIDASAFNESSNIKNEIREAVGVDQIVQGMQADNNATATEINAQMSQAGQRFSLFVRMLEREGLYQRAKIVYRMMLYYMRDMQLVPTVSMDGPKFYKFDPNQFNDSYEPRIQLESSIKSKKRQDQESTARTFEMLIADPSNNLWEAKKIMYPKMIDGLTEEELDRIIGSQPPEQPGMAPEGEMPPEMAPPMDMGAEMPPEVMPI